MKRPLRHHEGPLRDASAWDSEEPIRAELFGAERLEQHAESLAAAQTVTRHPTAVRPLADRLQDNGRVLLDAYRAIAGAIAAGSPITPAAEWLLDNFHVVEDQIRQIDEDLPPGYYRQLPKLANGALSGYPRVFGVAWAFIAHTDSRFDAQLLCRFVRAYQRVQPLSIGELWAIAITLRIVLIENLRRAAERIANRRVDRQQADELADRLLGAKGGTGEAVAAVLRDWDDVALTPAFSVQLLQRLRDQDPRVTPALTWLQDRLSAEATTPDAAVREEHHRQGASNVTVRNVITSMRAISAIDWADLFESVSLVDAALCAGSDFAQMDFPTRDRYRQEIEQLARGSRHSELEITQRLLKVATAGSTDRERDPGYHLLSAGRRAFAAALGFHGTLRTWPARVSAAAGIRGYIVALALVAAVLLTWPLIALANDGIGHWAIVLLALTGLLPVIDAATSLVNSSVTDGFGAKALPALELKDGIPAGLRTLVVVPVLLTTTTAIARQVDQLEVHHLASLDGDLCYALLSDWSDAGSEQVAGDETLLHAATAGIARLNDRHGPTAAGARFLLLHRRRVWNASQRQWMGWERKRGKLHELNRLLRGASDTTYVADGGGSPTVPAGVKYVITLDADTRLPRDTVRRLVGKMAHPLNRPRLDLQAGRVVEGYGILQPRVSPSLPDRDDGSIFQRLFSSASGIDPYAGAVSDVYQDLCGEGSYVGKGIYDVDAFEAALAGRIPDNALLSHDLFEGIFARAGLVSDVEVVEEYPARYDVAVARAHRWARGDWQLLPWIFGWGIDGQVRRHRRIPLIGRWKMLDNLRRTLSMPLTLLALVVGWTLPLHGALVWTTFLLLMLALPAVPPVLAAVMPSRRGMSMRSHFHALSLDLLRALSQTGLLVTFVAHQAASMCDAIVRTLYRLFISRRQLLEWVTAAQEQISPRLDSHGFFLRMKSAPAIGVIVLALAAVGALRASIAMPFALLWMLSPFLALRISRSQNGLERLRLDAADAHSLRLIARRSWRYFETFVTPGDHMLPPDNFQEDPLPVIAHRTSPTNIGLYLLATATARDLGWAGVLDTVERLEATLAGMAGLERYNGHLYNWYDTQDLRPLEPKYVSTVDSGNLAAHLLTLANGCGDMLANPLSHAALYAGIADSLNLARHALSGSGDDAARAASRSRLDAALDALTTQLRSIPQRPALLTSGLRSLAATAENAAAAAGEWAHARNDASSIEVNAWTRATCCSIASHLRDLDTDTAPGAAQIATRLSAIAGTVRSQATAMRFDFLYDTERKLLSIGFRVADASLDPSCYDLLASEARLASFIAVANGDLPARHWFRLGRAVTPVPRGAALVSWSGSMFEYLMPALVMRSPTGSLLEQTCELIVRRQRAYADGLAVPWGISESAYNARDLEFTYQYSSFGVPGLGLKRGLGDNIVVAPYATALAAMFEPHAATLNFARLADATALGHYGFYEALDYTTHRLPAGQHVVVVRAHMAHHQGMTIVALANTLLDGVMRTRFHSEPCVQATELLLQERPARNVALAHIRAAEVASGSARGDTGTLYGPLLTPHDTSPRTQLLSNGRYAVMLTGAGSGYSRWRSLAVTRWREDVTRDDWGSYVFVRDRDSGALWSAGFQPACVEPDHYEVTFGEDRATFLRHDGRIVTTQEVVVSPECDAEVRRITVTNTGYSTRQIELTSYAEIVLAPPATDTAHPAFAKLFVQTEYIAELGALLATRRRREVAEPEVWAVHLAVGEGEFIGELQFETDRARFIGRGRELRRAVAVTDAHELSGSVGTVLDPVFSLRRSLLLAPGATARVAFWTLLAPSREEALRLADKHRDATAFDRAMTLAWTQAQVQLHHLGISHDEAAVFQRLAGLVLYSDPGLRPAPEVMRRVLGGQPALWAHGLSGDLPIVLVRIDDTDDLDIVRQLLRAVEYWRLKQLAVDLVVLNERAHSYTQDLQLALEALTRAGLSRPRLAGDAPQGGSFVLRADLMSADTRLVLLAAARAVLLSRRGSLAEQLARLEQSPPADAFRFARDRDRVVDSHSDDTPPATVPELEFANGIGGFSNDAREYLTILRHGESTPAPWINVIANSGCGFLVSAEGSGYTWSGNSRDHQLTPWSNDPVVDRPGEAFYLRDDESGALWNPTALPIRHAPCEYLARHGRGYSRFEHTRFGIALELLQFVPLDAPVKISRLTVRNLTNRTRLLSMTAYVEWVLGASRAATAPFLTTELDSTTGALFARNLWTGHGERVAFIDLGGRQTSWSADRREFLGRNGSLAAPAALRTMATLSGRVGAGLDPCGALQTSIRLRANASIEIVCLLGEAASAAAARALITEWRRADVDRTLQAVTSQWDSVLTTVAVKTPDRSFDIMMNGWLLYQTLACRVWARSAFYQASGAYGFRDQLQDGMALVTAAPALTRTHLLRAAARQFAEGDVQHWWLPESGAGVRTRVADDRVWLCWCAAHYADATGEAKIFDESLPFLSGPPLHADEVDSFYQPQESLESGTLFEHCARALDQSLTVGLHGLPLIGTGDWNDGMNRVGAAGRGESVWLGWFLYATLQRFAPLAAERGEVTRAAAWRWHAAALLTALEQDGWDGGWYRRGYFDDGTALGSAASVACRIDSIAQSWAVISGGAEPARAARAMAAVSEQLIRREHGLCLLFTPPFDHPSLDPGYIAAYPPGVRENGGQYTHAAAWSVIAYALLGDGDAAGELFAMLNPINHALSRQDARLYRVEPYVVAADIYSEAQHAGRGGWTWYTGSSAWLYRAGLEAILGCRVQGATLHLAPCLPRHWPGFELTLRHHSSCYRIVVDNLRRVSHGLTSLQLDGTPLSASEGQVPLIDDGATHIIHAVLG